MTEFGTVTQVKEKHIAGVGTATSQRWRPSISQIFWDPLAMPKWLDLQRRNLVW